jgi:hypothetical protein
MTTLIFCATNEVGETAARAEALRADGHDVYARDAQALVYAAQGAGMERAEQVLATRAVLAMVRPHYPHAQPLSATWPEVGLTDSRGGEPGPAESGAPAIATDGPSGLARETEGASGPPVRDEPPAEAKDNEAKDSAAQPPRKRARGRADAR